MDGAYLDTALLVGRLLLAAIFIAAGLPKLANQAGWRQGLIAFGVPARLATSVGILLPLVELTIAAALVPGRTAWWGALGALGLLFIFSVGIGVNLAQGRRPDCHCFGQLHSAPVGWPTLARNGILSAITGLVVWRGPYTQPSVIGWLSELTTAQIAGVVGTVIGLGLLAVAGWLLLHLVRQYGRLLLRIEALEAQLGGGGSLGPGVPSGTRAPAFSLPDLDGGLVTLEALRSAGKLVLLLFMDPNCGPCTELLPELARWQQDAAALLTIAVISRGTPAANQAKLVVPGTPTILLQRDREVAEAYRVTGTPTAILVRPDGTIGSPLAPGIDAIHHLVARTVGPSAPGRPPTERPLPLVALRGSHGNGASRGTAQPVPLPLGAPAPALTLPDLTGTPVDLAAFRGRPTVVLFWNPSCGFCQRMLPDLKAWEARPPKGAPQLLVVSTGTVEANQALGLRSPLVLDAHFRTGHAFGVSGTPTAVLLDAQGQIASGVASGAAAVLALAAGHA